MSQYFVTTFAKDLNDLRKLPKFEFDLFANTAKPCRAISEFGFQIDGLLTISEIKQLVAAGYRVLIEEPVANRARARTGSLNFKQWLEQMDEKLKRQRLVK